MSSVVDEKEGREPFPLRRRITACSMLARPRTDGAKPDIRDRSGVLSLWDNETMSSTKIDLVRGAYDAYAKREFATVFSLCHPDLRISQTPGLPWGGSYHGPQGAREFFRKLAEHTDATPQPEEFFEAGDAVVVIGTLRGHARASGRRINLRIVHVWTVSEGRVVRFDAYIDTPSMLEALGKPNS